MIHILIPNNNTEERTYVSKVVFEEILGIEYEIKPDLSLNSTLLEWDNKTIIFKDDFWNKGGIGVQNLPQVKYSTNTFTVEPDIPILYGDETIKIGENNIECGVDIFASIFFMLTRWEEHVVENRDQYERFIGKESIAFKYGFLHRPIVNEYIEMIWKMMIYLGYGGERKQRDFQIVLTHDIDHPFMKDRFVETSKSIIRSLLSLDFKSIPIYLTYYLKDPYNTYNFLMDISERIGVKSHFYLMSSDEGISESKKSPYLTKQFKHVVSEIRKRNHVIGFHPGYFSILSENNWKNEKEELISFLGFSPDEGRQHYLRFNMPETFSFWEHSNMNLDSTLSYPDVEGFRCGTGDAFSVFNFLERKEYRLKERPLVIMDGTLMFYQGYSMEKTKDILNYYIGLGRKYKMPITLLSHNSIFIGDKGARLMKLYESCISSIGH